MEDRLTLDDPIVLDDQPNGHAAEPTIKVVRGKIVNEDEALGAYPTKRAHLIALAKRPQGVTIAEAVAATGWAHVSVTGTIGKLSGYRMRKEKRGRLVTHFLEPVGGPPEHAKPASLRRQIVELAKRPEGVTRADAVALTGWRAIDLPEIVRAPGFMQCKDKRDGAACYRLVPVEPEDAEPAPMKRASPPLDRGEIIRQLLERPEGASRTELKEADGFRTTFNIERFAKEYGFTYRIESRNGANVYFAAPSQTSEAPPPEPRKPLDPRVLSDWIFRGLELMRDGERRPLKALLAALGED